MIVGSRLLYAAAARRAKHGCRKDTTVAKRILDHLGLDSTGPPLAPPRVGEPDSVEPDPAYDVADPVHEG